MPKYTPQQLESMVVSFLPVIDRVINPRSTNEIRPKELGFALQIFEFGDGGVELAYGTNADPKGLCKALRECADKIEAKAKERGPR